jgi:hypothetical protein
MSEHPDLANPHADPCLICGEETAVGSVFYSDRSDAKLPDGTRGYLCSECVRNLRAKGAHRGFSERRSVEGSAIALVQAVF